MIQHTQAPAFSAALSRRLSFSPVCPGQWSRNASLPENMPVGIESVDGETRLLAWIDAPLDGPADYFYMPEPDDFTRSTPGTSRWESLEAMELHVIHEIAAAGATPKRFDIGFIIDAAFTWDDTTGVFIQKPGKTIAWASHWARLY